MVYLRAVTTVLRTNAEGDWRFSCRKIQGRREREREGGREGEIGEGDGKYERMNINMLH